MKQIAVRIGGFVVNAGSQTNFSISPASSRN